MNCPYCNYEDIRVVDSRPHEKKIRRRRECARCKKRFTTYEVIEMPILMVRKKDNSIETFSRDKLMHGILNSIKKRPVSMEQITSVVDKVENYCANEKKTETTTSEIGNLVLEELKNIDDVAYIRFASVYKEFNDVAGFIAEIGKLSDK
jgi:transcriptional repressor NrdR